MESATARIPLAMLAAALKDVAQIELDPGAASFEAEAAQIVRRVLDQPHSREIFYASLDRQWSEEEAANAVSYPENPGPLVLAEQREYNDGLDTIDPIGYVPADNLTDVAIESLPLRPSKRRVFLSHEATAPRFPAPTWAMARLPARAGSASGALDVVRSVPLFSLLTNDQAQGIADSVVKRRFRRGETVMEGGKKSNALFILLTGRARVLTADSRGREVTLAVLQPGDYVGEMSLLDNEPNSATVRAEMQTDMLILGRDEFARCLPEPSSLSYAVMRGLVQRVRSANLQIESLALLDVYGRIARTLLDMAEADGDTKTIRNKVSRQNLAKIVGASREMVSRVMTDLEERGMIETRENGSVVIKALT